MKSKLPSAITIQMPYSHSCVVFTREFSKATNQEMPKLYVQSIDAYNFQREFSLAKRYAPGDSKKVFWESHVYQHPGRREVCQVPEAVATAFIARFMEQVTKYPSLLFNATNDRQARNAGFVSFCERLHRGESPSVKML